MLSILFLALPALTSAQYCQPDILVDDFAQARRMFFDGADRQINLLDADYGTDNPLTTMTVDTTARTMTVYAGTNESFFFAKYNQLACFDLRPFYAFEFELEAPVGSTATFTLTQSSADCTRRIDDGDSVYLPLSRYYTTPGRRQVITQPFRDFAQNVQGGAFDFVHLKDWTMVAMQPQGARFVFRNMRLIGDRTGCTTRSSTTSSRRTTSSAVPPPPPPTTSRSTTSSVAQTTTSNQVRPTTSAAVVTTTSAAVVTTTSAAAVRSSTTTTSASKTTDTVVASGSGANAKFSWTTFFMGVVPILYLAFA